MSTNETARIYYSCVRSEINEHIRLKDQTLFLFIGAVGAIFGLALSGNASASNKDLLLIIPFLSLATSMIVIQHDLTIGAIARYCTKELDKFLNDPESPNPVPQWDDSQSLRSCRPVLFFLRPVAYGILVIIPAIIGLSVNLKYWSFSRPTISVFWWAGTAVTVVSISAFCIAYRFRSKRIAY